MSGRRAAGMRAQQHERATQARNRASAHRSPGAFAPTGLTDLQRSAGNAAVVRALAGRQDGGVAVQRLPPGATAGGTCAHEVLRSAGRPLPAPLREEMEARLGADFGDVEVHSGRDAARAAAELGAKAFTSGNHVVLGPGADDPHTLAHELTHVIQQRHGPVAGEDTGLGLRVSDPGDRFERAAEANAVRVMRASLPGPGATGPAVHRVDRAGTSVQRTVTVAGQEIRKRGLFESGPDTADATWQQVVALPSFQARSAEEQRLMEDQFRKWVDTVGPGQRGARSHPTYGRKRQDREYDTVEALELALHGWVAAKPGRRAEKQYAEQVKGSAEVDARLNVILVGIYGFIRGMPKERQDAIVNELSRNDRRSGRGTRPLGTYQDYFRTAALRRGDARIDTHIRHGFLDVLRNPADYDLRDKVVTLHDLMEYFGPHQPWLLPSAGRDMLQEPEQYRLLSTTGYLDGARQTDPGRGRLANQSSRDEHHPVTRFARERRLPIWSGSSWTAARMLKFADWAEADERDRTALAHSLFAFWRLDYDHSSPFSPHTLHETMDIASNVGVPYDPREPYAEFRYGDVDARQRELKADIDRRLGELVETIAGHRESLAEDPAAARSAEYAPAVAALDEAERLIRDFQDTYPTLEGGERTAAMNRVLRAFTLLADHSLT